QRRERQKLDAAAELLPAGCVVHGYLGDSFLFSSRLFFTVKPMPANHSEYFEALQGIGMRHSRLALSARQRVRLALIATYGARTWRPDPDSGKWRLQVRDNVMLFHTAPILSSVGAMLSKLDNGDCMPPLDQERHHHFQIHFKGGGKLSFLAHPPPLQDFLERAMELPMARTVTADRNTRSVPRQFMEYQHPDRLRFEAASMWRSIFRDPHGGDWSVALFQARLIFESVVGKAAKKIEF
ncbi:unnamed protein product, partial [Effrenium voratum]